MPNKWWRLILGVMLVLSWAIPVRAATHGRTEISVGFYETKYSADRIIPARVIPDGGHPLLDQLTRVPRVREISQSASQSADN